MAAAAPFIPPYFHIYIICERRASVKYGHAKNMPARGLQNARKMVYYGMRIIGCRRGGGDAMPQKGVKVVAQNRRARHDYFVLETWEAGIELKGTEVKSIRLGKCNLKDCYAAVKNGEMLVYGMHISPYEKGSYFNTDPLRPKRLLMHKSEIRKCHQSVMQQGLARIPLSVYLKDGRMKLELALCKGKKLYDKRDDMAKRDAQRDIERSMRARG